MEEGDACITTFHMPHTGTRNQHGTESRKNIIFRIRAKLHNPHVVVTGGSDHLDRGNWGEWLDPDAEPHDYSNPIDTNVSSQGAFLGLFPSFLGLFPFFRSISLFFACLQGGIIYPFRRLIDPPSSQALCQC